MGESWRIGNSRIIQQNKRNRKAAREDISKKINEAESRRRVYRYGIDIFPGTFNNDADGLHT